MTSVVGYIAIQDLTKMSDIIRSRTYEAFFPLIATAVIYFVIAYVLTLLIDFVEFKIDPKRRKRIVKGRDSKMISIKNLKKSYKNITPLENITTENQPWRGLSRSLAHQEQVNPRCFAALTA